MKPKDNYIIWREVNGIFTALAKDSTIMAWVIGTGKTTKSPITARNLELGGFEIY
jgi:hypothetical protein